MGFLGEKYLLPEVMETLALPWLEAELNWRGETTYKKYWWLSLFIQVIHWPTGALCCSSAARARQRHKWGEQSRGSAWLSLGVPHWRSTTSHYPHCISCKEHSGQASSLSHGREGRREAALVSVAGVRAAPCTMRRWKMMCPHSVLEIKCFS